MLRLGRTTQAQRRAPNRVVYAPEEDGLQGLRGVADGRIMIVERNAGETEWR